MAKYKVFGVTAEPDGVFDIPDNAKVIGALYHPTEGTFNVVVIRELLEGEVSIATEPIKEIELGEMPRLPGEGPSKESPKEAPAQ